MMTYLIYISKVYLEKRIDDDFWNRVKRIIFDTNLYFLLEMRVLAEHGATQEKKT